MQKKVLVMALTAIMALILAMPVTAQPSPSSSLGSLSSNTSMATAGIFKNDVDNFMNYYKYESVFRADTTSFSFITGRTNAGGVLDAGLAHDFGNIYLGIWYRGNMFKVANINETHTIAPKWDNNSENLLQTTETTSYNGNKWLESANQIEFLFGVNGQGIKVGFLEWLATDQNPGSVSRDFTITDYKNGHKYYTGETVNYENSRGYLKPYIGWGTNINNGDTKIIPFLDIGLQIYNDTLVDNYQDYMNAQGVKQNITNTVGAGNNNGALIPYGSAGVRLETAGKNTTTLEIKYGFDMNLYNNNYDATGLSGDVDGTVSWDSGYVNRKTENFDNTYTTTDITMYINKNSYMRHVITPMYKIAGEAAEGLNLGFSITVPVTITSGASSSYSDRYEFSKTENIADPSMNSESTKKTRKYSNQDTESSSLSIGLNMNFGASYKLIPNRFTINAGISAAPTAYNHVETRKLPNSVDSITTTKKKDALGNVTEEKTVTSSDSNDILTVNDTWSQWSANLFGGFTFYFNSDTALDLGVNSGIGSGNGFNLDVTTVNVIFTFKY